MFVGLIKRRQLQSSHLTFAQHCSVDGNTPPPPAFRGGPPPPGNFMGGAPPNMPPPGQFRGGGPGSAPMPSYGNQPPPGFNNGGGMPSTYTGETFALCGVRIGDRLQAFIVWVDSLARSFA